MAETPRKIAITVGNIKANAELSDCHTANEMWNALPIESTVNTWGDEIYFAIPVKLGAEDAKELVSHGDIAYWPPGTAFCIFFGPTPMSHGDEIRPAMARDYPAYFSSYFAFFFSLRFSVRLTSSFSWS